MFDFLPTLLYGALVLGVLVFVHELGHFLVAKWLGVRVISFSIGMGPRLFGFRGGDTDYRISLLPLGGFVRMAGDNPEEERAGEKGEFLEQPWWGRALIVAAGPGANLVFAVLLFFALYTIGYSESDYRARVDRVAAGSTAERVGLRHGDAFVSWEGHPAATMGQLLDAVAGTLDAKAGPDPVPVVLDRSGARVSLSVPRKDVDTFPQGLQWDAGTTIGNVLIGLPAYSAGLRDGDQILEVNGKGVRNWNELASTVRGFPDRDVRFLVRRAEQTFTVTAHTTPDGYIGVSPVEQVTVQRSFPPAKAAQYALLKTGQTTLQIYGGLWSFVTNPVRLRTTVAGPIAIAQVASQQASGGFDRLVGFAAFISLALMAMNLLPIPILDGGHIFFAIVEGVRRKPLSLKTQLASQRVGLIVLVGLVIFSFYNDLSRVSQRKRAEEDISRRMTAPTSPDTAGGAAAH
ncbi:MAG TPA: RIP metalloprotease RseP [Candidatus Eisenbacteria bacterium]